MALEYSITQIPANLSTGTVRYETTGTVVPLKNKMHLDGALRVPKVIIKYTATWCAPCKTIQPVFEEMARKNRDILFCSIDVDEFTEATEQCRKTGRPDISAMPTFLAYHDGRVVRTSVGGDPNLLSSLLEQIKS